MSAAGARPPLPGPLVSAEWLAAHLDSPGLVVADVRWVPGGSARDAYERGHLPDAALFDVDVDLAAPPAGPGGRHPLPGPAEFAAVMSARGVGDETVVIAYDDAKGSLASRLWWMLTVTGHGAAVLDGGLDAWDGPLQQGPARPAADAPFTPRPWPAEAMVDADEAARLASGDGAVLDLRAAERYRGEVEPIDPVAGHVPGAVSAPWTGNVDPANGRLLTPEALRERYVAIGVADPDRTAVYCGSGVTSCLGVLAMEVAGLGRPRLYLGSWSDWISDPARPVATGPDR